MERLGWDEFPTAEAISGSSEWDEFPAAPEQPQQPLRGTAVAPTKAERSEWDAFPAVASRADVSRILDESSRWTDRQKDDFMQFRKKYREQKAQVYNIGSPSLVGGLQGLGYDSLAILARATGQDRAADALVRQGQATEKATAEVVQERYEKGKTDPEGYPGRWSLGIHPSLAQAGRGMIRNIPPMIVAGGAAGPAGAIGSAAAQTGNQSITQGRDAGLRGLKLGSYVGTQAGLEAVFAGAFQKVGLGGAESLAGMRQAAAKTLPGFLKQVGLNVGAELIEEITTELNQNISNVMFDVEDVSAISPEAQRQTIFQAALQTLGTMGFMEAGSVKANLDSIRGYKYRGEIIKAAEEGRTPSRAEWKKWGLNEEMGRSAKDRARNLKDTAEVLRDMDAMERGETIQAEQGDQVTDQTSEQSSEVKVEQQQQEASSWGQVKGDTPVDKKTELSAVSRELTELIAEREKYKGGTKRRKELNSRIRDLEMKQGRLRAEAEREAISNASEELKQAIGVDEFSLAESKGMLSDRTPRGLRRYVDAAKSWASHDPSKSAIDYIVQKIRDAGGEIEQKGDHYSWYGKLPDGREIRVGNHLGKQSHEVDLVIDDDSPMTRDAVDSYLSDELGWNQVQSEQSRQQQQQQQADTVVDPSTGLNNVTSTKIAVRDHIIRKMRGEGPAIGFGVPTVAETINEADAMMRDDPSYAGKLLGEIAVKPRALSGVEHATLQLVYAEARHNTDALSDLLRGEIDPRERARISLDLDVAQDTMRAIETVAASGGTQWHHAGMVQQVELLNDYTPANLIRRVGKAKGENLNAKEIGEVTDLARKIKTAEQKVERKTEEAEQDKQDKIIDDQIKVISKEVRSKRAGLRRKSQAEKVAQDAWKGFKAKLAEKSKGRSASDFLKGEGGALDVELVESAMEVVRAYANLGKVTLSETLAAARATLGDSGVELFTEAWNRLREAGEIESIEFDPEDPASVKREVKRLQRSLVEEGLVDRDGVVDAVLAEMQPLMPTLTKREVADAMSGYGVYRELSKDEVNVAIREINGQLQQLSKIEDMTSGKPPAKTGMERREKGDVERQLEKIVNDLKRKGNYAVLDPAKQLKTALDAAKTAVRNRLTDMATEILAREKIVKQKSGVKEDAELKELRRRRDELAEMYKETFPPESMSFEKRAAIAEKNIDREIAALEADLKAGKIGPKAKKAPISTPKIDAKRAQLAKLREIRQAMRDAKNPKLTPEQKALKAYTRNLEQRKADYNDRLARGDFSRPKKEVKVYPESVMQAKYELEQLKVKFRDMEDAWYRKNATGPAKALHVAAEVLNTSRAIMTSFDLSALGRQGSWAAAGHPIMAIKATADMFKAIGSKRGEFDLLEGIRHRDNATLYIMAKLALTESEGRLSKMEEAFVGQWARYLPGVGASNRAYVAFLNRMRADMFDSLVACVAKKNGKVSIDQAKVIANYVNVATGRGPLNFGVLNLEGSSVGLATLFFSPKYQASRFQLLTGQPFRVGTKDVRKSVRGVIAKEYAKSATMMGMIVGSLTLAAGMYNDDDDDRPVIEMDPRSGVFLRPRFGDRYMDLTSGLGAYVTLASRTVVPEALGGGKTKTLKGKLVAMSGDTKPYGGTGKYDALSRFVRQKFSPGITGAIDYLEGENVVGEKVDGYDILLGMANPLAVRDAYEIAKTEIGKGQADSIFWAIFLGALTAAGTGSVDIQPKRKRGPKADGLVADERKLFTAIGRSLGVVD